MKVLVQKYKQNDQFFYSMVLPFSILDDCSEVLIYGKNEYGYQRDIDPRHTNSIKSAILKQRESLPTSIILSVDEEKLTPLLKHISDFSNELTDFFEMKVPDSKMFRVVDGQHRLRGLKEAVEERQQNVLSEEEIESLIESKSDKEKRSIIEDNEKNKKLLNDILNFPLNVIIFPVKPRDRVKEVIVFRDINSKAKKLRTDLTLLAIYNYELLEKRELTSETDLLKHLIIKTTQLLNDNKNSVWYNAIQFDIHEKPIKGIIGVAPMVNSLRGIVKMYIDFKQIKLEDFNSLSGKEKIEKLDKIAKEIEKMVSHAWNEVLWKWNKCFLSDFATKISEHRYSKDYYIQKTAGVHAIHMILKETFRVSGNNYSLDDFKKTIHSSPLKSSSWQTGDIFSGLTSQSGFKTAENLIRYGQSTPPDKNDTNN